MSGALVVAAVVASGVVLAASAHVARLALRHAKRLLRESHTRADVLFKAARVAANAPDTNPIRSPLPLDGLDHASAPFTGCTRTTWTGLATQMLTGLLHHTDGMRGPIRPPARLTAGYPRLESDGSVYGFREEYLEAFARSLWLAAPLLARDPSLRIGGRSVADYYREYLVRGTSPHDAVAFGTGAGPLPTPHIMEAVAICIALRQARAVLWEPLAPHEKARILAWLDAVRHRPVNPNNWRCFSIIVETFLKLEGAAHDAQRVRGHLQAIRLFHADAGWYRDLDKFDYYAAWSLQFYPILWALWDGDSDPGLRDELYERNDKFLDGFSHVFSRRGELPCWGRSPIYRFGAASPLPLAFLRPTAPTLEPGFARRLCSGALLQFTQHPDFLQDGIPSLGFLGERASLVDAYSGVTSPYWCAKLFVALTLPDDSPFWTARETEGFWPAAPLRYELGSTGMWVEHDRQSGHSRLHAPQRVPGGDPRYLGPWFDTADAV